MGILGKDIDGERILLENASAQQCCDSMRAFLRRHKIWMRDVLQSYQRKKCTPFDADIVGPDVANCTDFRPIFAAHSGLSTVGFTSEKAAEWTFRTLENQNLVPQGAYVRALLQKKVEKDASLEEYVTLKFKHPFLRIRIAQREIEFYTLPSPTGRSRKKGLTKQRKQDIYKHVLFTL